MVTGFGIIFLGVVFLGLVLTAFWVWMLVLAIKNPRLSETDKICWVLAIVFLHFIGGLLYYFIGHQKNA